MALRFGARIMILKVLGSQIIVYEVAACSIVPCRGHSNHFLSISGQFNA